MNKKFEKLVRDWVKSMNRNPKVSSEGRKMDEPIGLCPFCGALPAKAEGSTAEIYWIPHKDDCLLKTLFSRIQDHQIIKWQNQEINKQLKELLKESLDCMSENEIPYSDYVKDLHGRINDHLK